MSKKLSIVVSVLAVIAICLSATALIVVMKPAPADHTDVQYVMYLGTNGAETNEPVFAPEEAREKAKEILVKHFGRRLGGQWNTVSGVYARDLPERHNARQGACRSG